MFSSKRSRFMAAGITAIVIAGGSYGIVTATSSSGASTTTASSSTNSSGYSLAGGSASGGASNARSGPAAGGAIGTVSSVSASGFTLTTSASQKETIKETSSTTYENGTSQASVSAVTNGETALVLGTTNLKTITATQVIVQPPSTNATSPGGQVIPYSKGTQGSTQTVGTIPAGYTQGAGTIVSGSTADQAVEAALAVYPGGVVDRVVSIGGGNYEVHNIGVNWPHHIFVNSDFQVIGAND
jgi:membrane-bound inhibitor of C-type lysozyme